MKLPLRRMRGARFLLVCAAVGVAVLAARAVIASGAAAAPAVNAKLFAFVNEPTGPTNGISLKDANGVLVTNLDPGTYEIEVNDLSPNSSFHLTGPGVDITTGIDFVGHATWTVTFTDGTYLYHCDAMPTVMHGSFTVGGTPPPPPPPPAKCVVPKVVGKSLAKAKRRLSAAHCRTGAVRHGQSRLPRGIVYSQSRKPGARLPGGTKIGMRVSL
jgi:hypothetical protein